MAFPNISRRSALRGLTCGAAIPVAAAMTAPPVRAKQAAVAEPATPGMTPDEALNMLREGNANFVMDAPYRGAEDRARRMEIAQGQHPFAILVGCSDSRVPPELLFGRGLGELFIIRIAGNTVDQNALGSIEYAVAEFGVPLIVVLGHERCGAVKAAMEVVEKNTVFPGKIGDLVQPIIPAVLAARSKDGDLLTNAVRANVERVVAGLKVSGPIIAVPLAQEKLKIVGAYYDLDEGVVEFFDAHT